MNNLLIKTNPQVELVFNTYPELIRPRMLHLRKLILETANEMEDVKELEETLKWGEPSYLTKKGSTMRIDWKPKKPDQYAIYFSCTSKLIPTFRVVYNKTFLYEGNRAIVFPMNDKLQETELKKCIAAGLTYHKVKQLPLLGL